MKNLRLASLSLAVAAMLPSLTSCRSDESPFGWTISQQKADAIIQLKLNVEETRAAADERAISKLTVLVFDEQDAFETSKNVDPTENTDIILEVSQGLKTVYVVTAQYDFTNNCTNIQDFENSTFSSTLADLKGTDGFMMIGKSAKQMVMKASSADALPASNVFAITLERLVAKAQVKSALVDGSNFGINFGEASFKAFQLNNSMRVVANGTEVNPSETDNVVKGTFDNYTLDGEGYFSAVSEFTGEDCAYMSENIVATPVSGNTTFLGIRFATTPEKYYTYDSNDKSLKDSEETPAASSDYYVVGIQDKSAGVVDYVLVPGSKKIATFKTQEEAAAYAASLNGGDASAVTVSQTDAPMMAPSLTRATSSFEVITFTGGNVYYRVNVAHSEGSETHLKVLRNRFYKVNINSVSTLGYSDDELLRPSTPNSGFETSSKYWISVAIDVAPWQEVMQDANL